MAVITIGIELSSGPITVVWHGITIALGHTDRRRRRRILYLFEHDSGALPAPDRPSSGDGLRLTAASSS